MHSYGNFTIIISSTWSKILLIGWVSGVKWCKGTKQGFSENQYQPPFFIRVEPFSLVLYLLPSYLPFVFSLLFIGCLRFCKTVGHPHQLIVKPRRASLIFKRLQNSLDLCVWVRIKTIVLSSKSYTQFTSFFHLATKSLRVSPLAFITMRK